VIVRKTQELDKLKYAVLIQNLEEMAVMQRTQMDKDSETSRTREMVRQREREREDLKR
jgi:hypothetical protein